jgi:hypothetical protein
LILCVAALALAGCGGAGDAPSVASTDALRTKLVANGMGCTDYRAIASSDHNDPLMDQLARCTVNGESVSIATFSTNGALRRQIGSPLVRCYLYVVGANWYISPVGDATARQIAAATGGSYRQPNC